MSDEEEETVNTAPRTRKSLSRKCEGEGLLVGKAAEKKRNATGMTDAEAKVARPQMGPQGGSG